MKSVLSMFIAGLLAVGLAAGQEKAKSMTWEGYLVDQACGKKMIGEKGEQKAMKHTKDCALMDDCKASGYGIVTGGKYVKFADASDAKAVTFLEASKRENNMYVRVAGTMDGEKLVVTSIEEATKAAPKTEKMMEKKTEKKKG